ncbi:hypothetical protein, partial [Pseudomonas sp. RA_5y_Pfl1_P24]|uniref:hypothetical protein n=1 Tax=Pseudomonas sp. RA_5y_Pfl1_P24 TaxID=3088706 RepID=UPI0030DB4D75
GEAFWVTFGALPKVTRRKGETLSSRYRRNGYVLIPTTPHGQPEAAIAGKPAPTVERIVPEGMQSNVGAGLPAIAI